MVSDRRYACLADAAVHVFRTIFVSYKEKIGNEGMISGKQCSAESL